MILRIVLSIVLAAVAFALGGPILYYFWVEPESAAAAGLAKEAEAELARLANSKTFSREDSRATAKRMAEMDVRSKQLLAEKRRKRSRTWQIAIASAIVVGGSTFAALSWRARRRRAVVPATTSDAPPQ